MPASPLRRFLVSLAVSGAIYALVLHQAVGLAREDLVRWRRGTQ